MGKKTAALGLALAMLCLILSGCGLLNKFFGIGNTRDNDDQETPSQDKNIVDTVKDIVKERVKEQLDPKRVFGKDTMVLAFFGLDRNEEREKTLGSFRTDTIMIFFMDFNSKKVSILSIPRDTYVKIANKDYKERINAAFPFGGGIEGQGFENSINTITDFLGGIKIDRYFGMDIEVIGPLVDSIGGFEFYIDVTYEKGGYSLKEGLQHVDGRLAEQYVRFRYSPRGDIDRVERQQRFVLAFMKALKEKVGVDEMIRIYTSLKGNMYTDLSLGEITALAAFMRQINTDAADTYMVPGRFATIKGKSCWEPDMDELETILSGLSFYPEHVDIDAGNH